MENFLNKISHQENSKPVELKKTKSVMNFDTGEFEEIQTGGDEEVIPVYVDNAENTPNESQVLAEKDIKNKYANFVISEVWKRLASEGIENVDSLIGTRETIENKDSEKFWKNVKKEDIQKIIDGINELKVRQLEDFIKNGPGFDIMKGEFRSDDTSFLDTRISELKEILKIVE